MFVLKRRELRTVHASANVVPPASTSRVLLGEVVPIPTKPCLGTARITLPSNPQSPGTPQRCVPGCNVIEPPEPPTSLLVPPAPAFNVIEPPEPASWELTPPAPAVNSIPPPFPEFALSTPASPPRPPITTRAVGASLPSGAPSGPIILTESRITWTFLLTCPPLVWPAICMLHNKARAIKHETRNFMGDLLHAMETSIRFPIAKILLLFRLLALAFQGFHYVKATWREGYEGKPWKNLCWLPHAV